MRPARHCATSATVVECTRPPPDPVIVNVDVPLVTCFFVATVSVDVPEDAMEAGANVAVANLGTPLTDRLTVPENP